MENLKENIKKKILEIFDAENRPLNTREITQILRLRHKIIKSQPFIRKLLVELEKEGKLYPKK